MRKVLFLGRFAPPMHGAARMNELYFGEIKKDKNFKIKKIKLNKYDSLGDIGKLNFSKIKGYFDTYLELVYKIKEFNPDIIYLEMAPKGGAFLKDSIYVLISKLFHKKIFIQLHAKGAEETTKNKIAKQYYKFIFKNTRIILLSKILFSDIKNVAEWSQIEILPNGIPDEITDEEFKKITIARKKNKIPTFLFLSNMIESKGPLDVLKICNKLDKESVDFECNFVGKFQDEEFETRFKKQLKKMKLEKKCKYLGAKYGEDKKKILEKTDFLIFPTRYPEETFGLVIIEAFMYGIPVFSYNNASISEIISEDFLGYVSKIGEWKELEREIFNRLKTKINSVKIREYFKNKFEFSNSKKKLLEILSKDP